MNIRKFLLEKIRGPSSTASCTCSDPPGKPQSRGQTWEPSPTLVSQEPAFLDGTVSPDMMAHTTIMANYQSGYFENEAKISGIFKTGQFHRIIER